MCRQSSSTSRLTGLWNYTLWQAFAPKQQVEGLSACPVICICMFSCFSEAWLNATQPLICMICTLLWRRDADVSVCQCSVSVDIEECTERERVWQFREVFDAVRLTTTYWATSSTLCYMVMVPSHVSLSVTTLWMTFTPSYMQFTVLSTSRAICNAAMHWTHVVAM